MSVLETLEICFQANLSGVTEQLNGLQAQLGGVSDRAMAAAQAFRPAGAAMAAQLARGIASGRAGVTGQAGALASGLTAALSAGRAGAAREGAASASGFASAVKGGASGAKNAGAQLSGGMAAGIRSGRSAVTAAVDSVVSAALSRMRSRLKIHSPSKVTRDLGAHFGEGFAGGILNAVPLAADAAGSLGEGALSGLSAIPDVPDGLSGRVQTAVDAAVQSALGGVQLTVPLTVDGMKLGEASIRGINAVTKSAGKVLLNI